MLKSLTGMKDLFSPEIASWQKVESLARAHFALYNYEEIRTPLLEETGLFSRSIGEETGIVGKEMYTFTDKGGDSVTLRPEGTASVVRAYLENHLESRDSVTKLYYIGPMFRYERPQKGRLRQFHQIGCELIGPASAESDVEVIAILDGLVRKLGIADFKLELNSLGCLKNTSCRPNYLKNIAHYFEKQASEFCTECQRKIVKNPLRVFDCKNEKCQTLAKNAPEIFVSLCGECSTHFKQVEEGLKLLKISYHINSRIVRGLDYYDKTAFELVSDKLGAKDAFAGGGRYSGLISGLGGPETPAVGFALGMERLVMLMPEESKASGGKKIYLACLGEAARKKGVEIAHELRSAGLVCEMDYEEKSLKAQMRRADKLACSHVVIVGENEVKAGQAQVKDFVAKTQVAISLEQLPHYFV